VAECTCPDLGEYQYLGPPKSDCPEHGLEAVRRAQARNRRKQAYARSGKRPDPYGPPTVHTPMQVVFISTVDPIEMAKIDDCWEERPSMARWRLTETETGPGWVHTLTGEPRPR
jgi:hypothetical protein